MFKNFRKKHGLKKKEVKAAIELFEKTAKIKLSEAMTITYDDSIMLSSKSVKATLMHMGWTVQSIEVKKGDSVSYVGEWKLNIDVGNSNNELIGVFTSLTHYKYPSIENFTSGDYIETIATIGGPNWEKWYGESAVMAALKQTLRRSQLSFLAKPVVMIRLADLEVESVKDTNLIEEILSEVTGEDAVQSNSNISNTEVFPDETEVAKDARETINGHRRDVRLSNSSLVNGVNTGHTSCMSRVNASESLVEVKESNNEISANEARTDELVEELVKEYGGWIKIRMGRNLRREDWKTNRNILERFAKDIEENDQKLLADLLNGAKPYGLKSEIIDFNRTADTEPATQDVTEDITATATTTDKETPPITSTETSQAQSSDATQETAKETTEEPVAKTAQDVENQDFSTPFDEEPMSSDAEVEAWKASKLIHEQEWLDGEEDEKLLLAVKDSLMKCKPEGLAVGVIKIGKAWPRNPKSAPAPDTPPEEAPPAEEKVEPMSARQWMVEFGVLERRWSEGESGEELYRDAVALEQQTPKHINTHMLAPEKYREEKK